MQYDAITIDTCIFDKNHLNLEGGLLGQLTQFKGGTTQFILSEIILREVRKHLIDGGKNAKESLKTAIKKTKNSGLLSNEASAQLTQIYNNILPLEEAAEQRLESFKKNTGAEIVSAGQVEMESLIELYFKASAPFKATGDKKNEFPDAIALLSMEVWAKSNNKKILAISGDGDWANFASGLDWIDVQKDLGTALAMLQKDAEQATSFVASLLKHLDDGKMPDLYEKIIGFIAKAVSWMSFEAEADTEYAYEYEDTILGLNEFKFDISDDTNKYNFNVVQIGRDKIVAKIFVWIDALAECHFTLFSYDNEGDKIFRGEGDDTIDTKFRTTMLVTINTGGEMSIDSPELVVSDVELADINVLVDFGSVRIGYEDYRN